MSFKGPFKGPLKDLLKDLLKDFLLCCLFGVLTKDSHQNWQSRSQIRWLKTGFPTFGGLPVRKTFRYSICILVVLISPATSFLLLRGAFYIFRRSCISMEFYREAVERSFKRSSFYPLLGKFDPRENIFYIFFKHSFPGVWPPTGR